MESEYTSGANLILAFGKAFSYASLIVGKAPLDIESSSLAT